MLRGLAKELLIGAVERGTGVSGAGPVSAALLTTGVSLALVRGRRPLGFALLAAGGLLRWREVERAREAATLRPRPVPAGDASPATGSR